MAKKRYTGGNGSGKTPKVPMPKVDEETSWKPERSGGGGYKPRPMNPEQGIDESPSSNYGAAADKTFDKGRGTGTTGTKTWAETSAELKSGNKRY